MKLLQKTHALFDRIIEFLAFLAGGFLIFILLGVTVQVISRALWDYVILWMLPWTEFSMLYITFLGTAWVLREERHVKMDLVLSRCSPRTQAILNTITSMVAIGICLVVFWYAAQVTWHYFQMDYRLADYARTPKFPIMAIVPIGCFLLAVQFLRRSHWYLKSR